MVKPRHVALLILGSLSASSVFAQVPNYQVKDLGTLGGRFTEVTGLNALGQVTGYSEAADGQVRAFVYEQGEMRDLGSLGGGGSLARAINDAGQVTGFSITATGAMRAFVYQSGQMTDLGTLGGESAGKAISSLGQVAGESVRMDGRTDAATYSALGPTDLGTVGTANSTAEAIDALGDVAGNYTNESGSHAFVYRQGTLLDLFPGQSSFVSGTRSINSSGAVTGGLQSGATTRAFLYTPAGALDIGTLGGDYAVGLGVSDAGHVTGISALADGTRHAFVYTGTAMSDVGTLGGPISIGYALNNSDQVVGNSQTASGASHAFVLAGGAMIDLGQLIEALAPAGTVIDSVAFAINDAGDVAGRYSVSDPTDAQMPVKSRGFIATSGSSLLQRLLLLTQNVGPGHSLADKVNDALGAYNAQDTRRACRQLDALVHEVDAQNGKKGRKIEPQSAAEILQQEQMVTAVIGCG